MRFQGRIRQVAWLSGALLLVLMACQVRPVVVEPTAPATIEATFASGAGETPLPGSAVTAYPVATLPAPAAYPAPGAEATLPAETPAPETAAPTVAPTPPTITYTIQSGDSLQAIADSFGVTVDALMATNALTNPNQIAAGQTLVIPLTLAVQQTHVVQAGETLGVIAEQYQVNWRNVAALNGLTDPYILYAGQELLIPAP